MSLTRLAKFFLVFLSFCGASVFATEISTVITSGYGKDVEKATQRAAEAALTQVVGSFIDSKKMVEKHREIREGIRTQVKKVDSKITEYAQGSIQKIEVISVEEQDGMFNVSARVDVRIEDFRHYIEETVLAEKTLQQGFIAKIKTRNKQQDNLETLIIDKVIKPVHSQKAIKPVINGDIEEVTETSVIKEAERYLKGDGYLIRIPVSIVLDEDYLSNAVQVLDETAEKRFKGVELTHSKTLEKLRNNEKGLGLYAIIIADFVSVGRNNLTGKLPTLNKRIGAKRRPAAFDHVFPPDDMQLTGYFQPDDSVHQLCTVSEQVIGIDGIRNNVLQAATPKIRLALKSEADEVLYEDLVAAQYNGKTSGNSLIFPAEGYQQEPSINASRLTKYGWQQASLLNASLKYSNRFGNHVCMVFIDTRASFHILTRVPEEVLSKTRKVTVNLIEPEHIPLKRSAFR